MLKEMVLKSFYAVAVSPLSSSVRRGDFVRVSYGSQGVACGAELRHNYRDLLSSGATRALVMI